MRKTQADRLLDVLRANDGHMAIQEIRNTAYIANPGDAVKRLRERGCVIETYEIRRTENNRPVSGYRLVSEPHVHKWVPEDPDADPVKMVCEDNSCEAVYGSET